MANVQAQPLSDTEYDLEVPNIPQDAKEGSQKAQATHLDYWQQLVRYGKTIQRDEPPLLDFGMLRRINLVHIQNELAEIKADVANTKTTTQEQMEKLRRLTHEYGELLPRSLTVNYPANGSNSYCNPGF
jgi:hypothetical protein